MHAFWNTFFVPLLFGVAAFAGLPAEVAQAAEGVSVYPGADWSTCTPEAAGLSQVKLQQLSQLIGGRGCVVRHGRLVYQWGDSSQCGDIASAVKPIISALLLLALQQKKIASVDALVADVEPRLRALNHSKDVLITWRHLASPMSGYGLSERPGQAYASTISHWPCTTTLSLVRSFIRMALAFSKNGLVMF
jgi:hypothetical protein